MSSKVTGCTILHSYQQWISFCCSTSSPEFAVVSVLDFGHSNRCVVICCCFNLQLLNDMWCWASFNMLIFLLYIFFGEVSVQVFCPFKIRLFSFLLLSFKSSLHMLDISLLSDISVDMMNYTNWFSNVEPALHIRDKFHLIVAYNSFYTLLDYIC